MQFAEVLSLTAVSEVSRSWIVNKNGATKHWNPQIWHPIMLTLFTFLVASSLKHYLVKNNSYHTSQGHGEDTFSTVCENQDTLMQHL